MKRAIQFVCVAVLVVSSGSIAMAEVTIETVPVDNSGNVADNTSYGAVSYDYRIGKYEVSNAEYVEFLNTVDAGGTDLYDLYNSSMGSGYGGITFTSGNPNGSKYSVRSGRGNMPVNYVSFWDACRFANWLHNGQGGGGTGIGVYTLIADDIANNTVARNEGWRWAVCSEDEWYKAAYYDGENSVYYDYPTGSNTAPTAEAPPGADMTNGSANYWDGDYIDTTYYTTEVGAYTGKPSESAYGTFDQGGNVWEWNEAIIDVSYRGLRGGAFEFAGYVDGYDLSVNVRSYNDPTTESYNIGFRVAQVPEPATLCLLSLGGITLLRRKLRGHIQEGVRS